MEWVLVKTFLSLAAVLGLMFGIVWLLRRFTSHGATHASRPVDIEVLGYRMLEQKKSVFVLKVLQNVFVVGVTEQGMNTLGEIRDEKSLGEVEERVAAGRLEKTSSFSTYFAKHLGSIVWGGLRRGEHTGVIAVDSAEGSET